MDPENPGQTPGEPAQPVWGPPPAPEQPDHAAPIEDPFAAGPEVPGEVPQAPGSTTPPAWTPPGAPADVQPPAWSTPPVPPEAQPPAWTPPAAPAWGAPPAAPADVQPPAWSAPPAGPYGTPPQGQYGTPPPGWGAPPQGQYRVPPQDPYGAPAPGPYGAPPPGWGAPMPVQPAKGGRTKRIIAVVGIVVLVFAALAIFRAVTNPNHAGQVIFTTDAPTSSGAATCQLGNQVTSVTAGTPVYANWFYTSELTNETVTLTIVKDGTTIDTSTLTSAEFERRRLRRVECQPRRPGSRSLRVQADDLERRGRLGRHTHHQVTVSPAEAAGNEARHLDMTGQLAAGRISIRPAVPPTWRPSSSSGWQCWPRSSGPRPGRRPRQRRRAGATSDGWPSTSAAT